MVLLEHLVCGALEVVHQRLEGNLYHVAELADLLVKRIQRWGVFVELQQVLAINLGGKEHIIDDAQLLCFRLQIAFDHDAHHLVVLEPDQQLLVIRRQTDNRLLLVPAEQRGWNENHVDGLSLPQCDHLRRRLASSQSQTGLDAGTEVELVVKLAPSFP